MASANLGLIMDNALDTTPPAPEAPPTPPPSFTLRDEQIDDAGLSDGVQLGKTYKITGGTVKVSSATDPTDPTNGSSKSYSFDFVEPPVLVPAEGGDGQAPGADDETETGDELNGGALGDETGKGDEGAPPPAVETGDEEGGDSDAAEEKALGYKRPKSKKSAPKMTAKDLGDY